MLTRLTRALATAAVAAALVAPAASARPIDVPPAPTSSPRPTVTRTIDEGVDLGSAAIGAGAATAALLLAAAGAATRRRRRQDAGTGTLSRASTPAMR